MSMIVEAPTVQPGSLGGWTSITEGRFDNASDVTWRLRQAAKDPRVFYGPIAWPLI